MKLFTVLFLSHFEVIILYITSVSVSLRDKIFFFSPNVTQSYMREPYVCVLFSSETGSALCFISFSAYFNKYRNMRIYVKHKHLFLEQHDI